MIASKVGIGMKRVTPGVQRVQAQPVRGDLVEPVLPGLRTGQQLRHVAMRVRGVAAGADFNRRDLRRRIPQPGQDLIERPIDEGFKHDAYLKLAGIGVSHLDHTFYAYVSSVSLKPD